MGGNITVGIWTQFLQQNTILQGDKCETIWPQKTNDLQEDILNYFKKLPWYSLEVTERNHDGSLNRAGLETGNATVGLPETETRTPTESFGVRLNGKG